MRLLSNKADVLLTVASLYLYELAFSASSKIDKMLVTSLYRARPQLIFLNLAKNEQSWILQQVHPSPLTVCCARKGFTYFNLYVYGHQGKALKKRKLDFLVSIT
uniref:Putative secreted protein n=1 Tax=Ixodes ricinus TaxID=34613 RepID=A0A147BMI7_IXORI